MESLSNSIEKAQHSELELTKEYLVLAEQATINASFELAYDYSQKALIHAQNIQDDLLQNHMHYWEQYLLNYQCSVNRLNI